MQGSAEQNIVITTVDKGLPATGFGMCKRYQVQFNPVTIRRWWRLEVGPRKAFAYLWLLDRGDPVLANYV